MNFFDSIVLFFVFLLIGGVVTLLLFKKNACKEDGYKIFSISLVVYSLYSIIVYSETISRGEFLLYSDQEWFYQVSQELGGLNNIQEIFKRCFIYREHIETEGAYFYMGVLSFIANKFFSGNSIIFQMLNVVFLASLINIFVYRILLFFIEYKNAFKYALIYVFGSYIFFYSPWLLRDIHIALLYAIALTLLFSSFKVYKLFLFIPIILITVEFRFEHGVFLMIFPFLYVYDKIKDSKKMLFFTIILFCSGILYFSSFIISNLSNIFMAMENYEEFTIEQAEETGGLGRYIFYLPIGVRQIVSVIYSQMSPFPSWNLLLSAKSLPDIIIGIIAMISPIYWFIVWYIVITNYVSNKGRFQAILKYSGIILVCFLFANSGNMTIRRIICMYPVIYLFYCVIKENIENFNRKIFSAIKLYVFISILYLVIK